MTGKEFKDITLKVLFRIWSVGIPLILALALVIGVFFGLWKTLALPLAIVIPISIAFAVVLIFATGKMMRLW